MCFQSIKSLNFTFPLHLYPSIVIHIYPFTYFSSISSVSFSYPRYSIICSTGIFFFVRISFSPLISSSSSWIRLCRRSLSSSSCFFSLKTHPGSSAFMVLLIVLLVLSLDLLLSSSAVSTFYLVYNAASYISGVFFCICSILHRS